MESDTGPYIVRLLADCPNFADDCCVLINQEWKRSHQARMRSLNKTLDKFPLNFILIKDANEKGKVVGHCRASRIQSPDANGPAAFLETVVIAPDLRGQGLGRYLITEVEKLLGRREIRHVYLSTKGQEEFYKKIGYTKCKPIDIFARVPYQSIPIPQLPPPRIGYWAKSSTVPTPPPPPPPPLPPCSMTNDDFFYEGSKTFMCKTICPSG